MKNKRNVLFCLIIVLAGVIYFTVQARQKNGTHRADFSGEWKSKESISIGGNIACLYDAGDRMRSKTMKITEQADFLTVEVPNPSPGAAQVTSRERLTFDGKKNSINYPGVRGKIFTVKFSADGETMTINSIANQVVVVPYHAKARKQLFVNVTEVWKLSNDGKSITIQANAKPMSFGGERSWKTVFYKAR